MAVAGANECVPNLEPSGVGAADRVLDLFTVEGGPVVVAEADADDEFVQAGEPVVIQADAEPVRVVPSTNGTTKALTGSLVSMTCGGIRSPGVGVTAAKLVYYREVAESFGGERTADTRLVPEFCRRFYARYRYIMGNRNHGNSWKLCQRSETPTGL